MYRLENYWLGTVPFRIVFAIKGIRCGLFLVPVVIIETQNRAGEGECLAVGGEDGGVDVSCRRCDKRRRNEDDTEDNHRDSEDKLKGMFGCMFHCCVSL